MLKSPSSSVPTSKKMTQMLLGIAVVTLLGGAAVVFLLNSQIAGLQAVASNKKAVVGSSEQIARRYQSTLDEYNTTLARLQFLETSVTQKSYVPTLLKQMQNLATATHLTVTSIHPSTPPPPPPPIKTGDDAGGDKKKPAPPPYDMMDIAIDVKGNYADTASFLYGLTRFPKIISVTSVQMHPGLNPGQNPLSAPIVSSNLHLTAYVFHDDDTAAVVAPATAQAVSIVPPPATGTVAGAAGRATLGAVNATHAAQEHSQTALKTL